MSNRKSGIRRALLSLLLVLPLIAGAAYLGWSGLGPSAAWERDGGDGAAPGPVPGIDVAQVQEARRALGEAGTNAGFLELGMRQADEGIDELREGGSQLAEGTGTARQGAADLAEGMSRLQAGTESLGTGARELADGATAIGDNIGLVAVAAGQVEAAIGPAKESLRNSNDPGARDALMDLESLERQLQMVDFDAIATEAGTFRDGANELASQLDTPGSEYRDGVYTAAQGANALRDGIAEIDDGAGALDEGLGELQRGSDRLSDQVGATAGGIRDAQRAMPVPTADQLAAAGLAADDDSARSSSLAPTLAFVVSAMVMLGASALWLIGRPGQWAGRDRGSRFRWLPGAPMLAALAGIVAVGAVVLFVMADGLTLLGAAAGILILGLAALAATALARAVLVVFGGGWGRLALILGMLVQVGLIGWVWRSAAAATAGGAEQAVAWGVVSALLPLHHPTAALTALGNGGSTVVWGVSAGVLLALVVIGALIERFGGGRALATATTAGGSAANAGGSGATPKGSAAAISGSASSATSKTTSKGAAADDTATVAAEKSPDAGEEPSESDDSEAEEPAKG